MPSKKPFYSFRCSDYEVIAKLKYIALVYHCSFSYMVISAIYFYVAHFEKQNGAITLPAEMISHERSLDKRLSGSDRKS